MGDVTSKPLAFSTVGLQHTSGSHCTVTLGVTSGVWLVGTVHKCLCVELRGPEYEEGVSRVVSGWGGLARTSAILKQPNREGGAVSAKALRSHL